MKLRNGKEYFNRDTANHINKLPPELLSYILSYTDIYTLLNCRLVSKQWKDIVKADVFRNMKNINYYKELMARGGKNCNFKTFFLLSKMNPLGRNFLKYSDRLEYGNWDFSVGQSLFYNPGILTPIEHFPVLRDYELSNTYSVSGSQELWFKTHFISFERKGITTDLIDKLKPKIELSSWFALRRNSMCTYTFTVELLSKSLSLIRKFKFTAENGDGRWTKMVYLFENYERGVANILINHHVHNPFYRDELPEFIYTGEALRVYFK